MPDKYSLFFHSAWTKQPVFELQGWIKQNRCTRVRFKAHHSYFDGLEWYLSPEVVSKLVDSSIEIFIDTKNKVLTCIIMLNISLRWVRKVSWLQGQLVLMLLAHLSTLRASNFIVINWHPSMSVTSHSNICSEITWYKLKSIQQLLLGSQSVFPESTIS